MGDWLLWFAVRLYAITLALNKFCASMLLWFAVRLYAITLKSLTIPPLPKLWFAVRLYAITLQRSLLTACLSVVVCGQAICDYT